MTENDNKNKTLLLGCIADDITGATDLGLMLASNGLPTTLCLGIPDPEQTITTEALVIALKIRTEPADIAVAAALQAADYLLDRRAQQLFYKYCSTFDSTPRGNIGPVSNALLERLGEDFTVILPSFPTNGRTVRDGKLFVGDQPLSESSMRNHPLTPMTESYLPTLMDAQTGPGQTVAITQDVVDGGTASVLRALQKARASGKRYASIDTGSDQDLLQIAGALRELKLITGGAGIAGALPNNFLEAGLLKRHNEIAALPKLPGHAAVLAGSCSEATRGQVAHFENSAQTIVIDPQAIMSGSTSKQDLADSAIVAASESDVLVYSSTDPQSLQAAQTALGIAESAQLVEDTLAHVARCLADSGICKFVVAGGETSGAVAAALGIKQLQISQEIDPGVPWMLTPDAAPVCLAFKSGNFGRPDFFAHALGMLP